MKKNRKIKVSGEGAYVLAILFLTFGTMLLTKADFGLSMVVAPAYLISEKIEPLTFGMAEYLVQGLLLVAFCIVVRQFKWKWLLSFATAFIYGLVLDLFFLIFQNFTPDSIGMRIAVFVPGVLTATLGIAFFFQTYLPLEVYELFVKGVAEKFHFDIGKTKIVYDTASLLAAVGLSFLFFHKLVGIGIGTIVCTVLNGIFIKWWGLLLVKIFDFSSLFKKKEYTQTK